MPGKDSARLTLPPSFNCKAFFTASKSFDKIASAIANSCWYLAILVWSASAPFASSLASFLFVFGASETWLDNVAPVKVNSPFLLFNN